MNRTELASVLRRSRERIAPGDVGLPSGSRRRTPGLRREEVALLAGISVDYVVRLEQGRGPVPSPQVLGSLARALRFDAAGRDQLFHLAGVPPPGPGTIDMHVRPSVLRLLDRFADLPVVVMSAKGDVLAWNEMACALQGDWSAIPPHRRNINRLRFLPDPADPPMSGVGATAEEFAATAEQSVAMLRSAAARYPDDAGVRALIDDLRRGSALFVDLWNAGRVGGWRSHTKTVRHPVAGAIVLDCDTLHVPDVDQSLIVYSAAPGTPAAESLALVRVLGMQSWDGGTVRR
ncbi:helix-turn-helix transcriptional regulator [Rhodococcus yananensis]|uniref:helix-turn-helix transcriptional regulator n=1 Tax=Rhodococcus yananensis TaxID=2879464 RepID=UPI003EB6FF57